MKLYDEDIQVYIEGIGIKLPSFLSYWNVTYSMKLLSIIFMPLRFPHGETPNPVISTTVV